MGNFQQESVYLLASSWLHQILKELWMEWNSAMPQNGDVRNHPVYYTTLLPHVNVCIALSVLAAKKEITFKEKKTKKHSIH